MQLHDMKKKTLEVERELRQANDHVQFLQQQSDEF